MINNIKKTVFCITMYNENNTVQMNINTIRNKYKDNVSIIVIQSKSIVSINNADIYIILPNFSNKIEHHKLPAYAITRNYSSAFTEVYKNYIDINYIIAITGDTLISNIECLDILYSKMIKSSKVMCVSQAIGQDFHSANSNPQNVCGGRYQYDGISDFMPQFFMVEGNFANKTKVFSNIEITNEYCSEQCLGDELFKYIREPFDKDVLILAKNAYDYNDGIIYHNDI